MKRELYATLKPRASTLVLDSLGEGPAGNLLSPGNTWSAREEPGVRRSLSLDQHRFPQEESRRVPIRGNKSLTDALKAAAAWRRDNSRASLSFGVPSMGRTTPPPPKKDVKTKAGCVV